MGVVNAERERMAPEMRREVEMERSWVVRIVEGVGWDIVVRVMGWW